MTEKAAIDPHLLEMRPLGDEPPYNWSLSSRFAMTAARAALELDWLVRKQEEKIAKHKNESICLLLRFWREDVALDPPTMKSPIDFHVFMESLKELGKPQTRDEVRAMTGKMREVCEGRELGEAALAELRQFCVIISDRAANMRQKVYQGWR